VDKKITFLYCYKIFPKKKMNERLSKRTKIDFSKIKKDDYIVFSLVSLLKKEFKNLKFY